MATNATTITAMSNSLRRTYSDKFFKAFQNDFTPTLDELDECPDEPTRGVGWFFPFYDRTPQNWRINAEGGAMGTVKVRNEYQGQVNAVEFLAWLQISDMLKNAGVKDAAWNGGELNRQMKETTMDITKGLQRLFVISHGTGRLAVVETTTVGTNQFVGKNNEGVTCLLEGDLIDVYDTDTAGTIQMTARTVTAINRVTRTVTFSGAVASLTAGWGIYKSGDYGVAPNGFHGLIDNGTFTDNVHSQSRAAHPKLNAQVRGFSGTATQLEEEHLRQVHDDIWIVGGAVDKMACNTGVMNAFFDITAGDARYAIEKGQTAKRVLGYKDGDSLFAYGPGEIVIRRDPNIPARTMYFYSLKNSFWKNTLRKLGWLDEGGSLLRLTPNGQGFETSWTALTATQVNISCYAPLWNGRRDDILDKSVAGDS